jgi:hypothetical protein
MILGEEAQSRRLDKLSSKVVHERVSVVISLTGKKEGRRDYEAGEGTFKERERRTH